jgi:hypothetical protein
VQLEAAFGVTAGPVVSTSAGVQVGEKGAGANHPYERAKSENPPNPGMSLQDVFPPHQPHAHCARTKPTLVAVIAALIMAAQPAPFFNARSRVS